MGAFFLICYYVRMNSDRKIPEEVRYVIGIDEAGRGPLAGSVAVGVVVVPIDFEFGEDVDLRDSKKHTEKQREKWYEYLLNSKKESKLNFTVEFTSSEKIDEWGIVKSVQSALCRALKKLDLNTKECLVLLDGGLKAPVEFIYQETIIRGDSKEKVISLASIAAKVERDRIMVKLAEKYPNYYFESHKGYGTKKHFEMIKENGMCEIHRRSFLKSMV